MQQNLELYFQCCAIEANVEVCSHVHVMCQRCACHMLLLASSHIGMMLMRPPHRSCLSLLPRWHSVDTIH